LKITKKGRVRTVKKGHVTLKSLLPNAVTMELQYELADTARKLVGIRKNIWMEFRRGSGQGNARGTRATIHFSQNADWVLDTIIHELCHVKDHIDGKKFGDYHKNWKNRPLSVTVVKAIRSDVESLQG
jgi:hypothetical protein